MPQGILLWRRRSKLAIAWLLHLRFRPVSPSHTRMTGLNVKGKRRSRIHAAELRHWIPLVGFLAARQGPRDCFVVAFHFVGLLLRNSYEYGPLQALPKQWTPAFAGVTDGVSPLCHGPRPC